MRTSPTARGETRDRSKTRLALRLAAAAFAGLLSQAIPAALMAAPVFAAKDPASPTTTYSAAAWPTTWTAYTFANGTAIVDPQGEPGISPDNVDIASDAGTQPSVYYAYDGTNVFFRLRLLGNPADSKKGGFDNAFWLVQLATTDNVVRAVVGLNGKPVDTDYVYVSNGDGSNVTTIYQTPFDSGTHQDGARSSSDNNGQYFVDFQVPMSAIYAASGNTVSAATPVHLVFGSSQAANLATINKDGIGSDYSLLAAPALRGPSNTTTTVACAPSGAVTYGSAKTCTITVTDNAATEPSQPTGSVSLTAVDGDLSAASCTLSGATANTSTCDVTFTASSVGAGSVGGSYAGDGAHNASSGSTGVTVTTASLDVTASSDHGTYGDTPPAFTGTLSGFVNGDTASSLSGTLSCTTTANSSSATGVYPVNCSGLSSSNYTINWNAGTYTVLPATPTITSGVPPTLTYGDGLPNDPTGGDTASIPGTFSYAPAPGTVLGVGTHTVHVTFTPTDSADYNSVEYDVSVDVVRATLTVTAQDAQRDEGAADPTFTVHYDGFVNGDDESSLAGTLSCVTDATADSTPGDYTISCSGLLSDNYDVQYVDATLTVNAKQDGGAGQQPVKDTTAPDATAPSVSFVTGSVINASGKVRLHTTWSASDETGLAETQLQRSVGNKPFSALADVSCPTGTTYDAQFDSSVGSRKQVIEQTRATDTSANTSDWVGGPFWVNDYQINSRSLHYGSKWRSMYGSAYWHGGIKSTVKPNATVTFTARGSALALVSALGPDMGMVQISVDGDVVATLDLYAAVPTYRYVAWSTSFDAVGSHTVSVKTLGTKNDLSTGTRVVIDALMAISDQPGKVVTPGLS